MIEKLQDLDFVQRKIFKIVTKQGELSPFNPNFYQKQLNEIAKKRGMMRLLVLKCRQIGASTWGASFVSHRTMYQRRKSGLIVADDGDNTTGLFNMCKRYYDNADPMLRPMRRYSNEKALVFDNPDTNSDKKGLGSQITIATAGKLSAGRSKTIQYLHASEFAYWPNAATIATGLFQSVPILDNTAIIIESTANGVTGKGSEFYNRCMRALDGDTAFDFIFFNWLDNPEYEMAVLRDFKPTDFEKELMRFYPKLTPRKLMFRRYKINNEMGSALIDPEDQFKQEYPLCVTGETKVSTELGILPIKDSLLAKKTESGDIERSGPQPESDIYKLKTKMGRELRGTGDHPVHTPSGEFYGIADLVPGQKITIKPPMFAESVFTHAFGNYNCYKTSVIINEEWARWLGYFMGDGSWYKGCVSIACDAKDQDVVLDVADLCEKMFGGVRIKNRTKKKGSRGADYVIINITPAKELFKTMGIIHSKTGNALKRNIKVPDCIWRSPKNIVREFLSALFECDGSASANKVRWTSSKKQFAQDIQLLLLGFGINGKITHYVKKNGCGREYNAYTIDLGIINSIKFHEEIGFIGQRKRSLKPIIPDRSRGGVPPENPEMIDYVESVVKDGHEITYDFTIKDHHTFMANGILTHNTPLEAFISSGRPVFKTDKLHSLIGKCKEVERYSISGGTLKLDPNGPIYIKEKPMDKMGYAIGADVAEGLKEGDDSAFTVLSKEYKQVAWYAGKVDPDKFGAMLVAVAKHFNGAVLAPEQNNHGHATLAAIKNLNYNKVFKREVLEELGSDIQVKVGWLTNAKTKMLMMDELVAAFRDDSLEINDPTTLREMIGVAIEDDGNIELNGKDRTVALAIAIQAVKQAVGEVRGAYVPGKKFQKDVTKMTIEEKMRYYKRGGR